MDEFKSEIEEYGTVANPELKTNLLSAIASIEIKDYTVGLRTLQELDRKTENVIVLSCLGFCYKMLGQSDSARETWERAIKLPIVTPSPYINLGYLYYEENDLTKAILYWTIATTIAPDNTTALYNLAIAYNKKGFRVQSLMYYEKFINYNKNINTEVYKTTKETINKLRKLASVNNHMGMCHYNSSSFQEALNAYLTSVSNYPIQPQISSLIGKILYYTNDFQSAVDHWLNAFITSEFDITMYDKLPYAYEHLNMPSYAYCFYYMILNDNTKYHPNLKDIRLKLFKLTPMVYKDVDYSKIHYASARKYELENNYLNAFIEYNNAFILAKSNKDSIEADVIKMKNFIFPDHLVAEALVTKIDEALAANQINRAKDICERVIILAKLESNTQKYGVRKREECLNLLRLAKD